ncbi:hypothetical protein LK540_12725 [Massilia sp. IC2-278]|uniref:hypothetical protein n=1 Tax=Massilia sp. IC2-278 TaxID=2887200 RepID=UPI001E2BE80A|nr:hypothetical protein [Massilia sp. IC2-278]MCC2961287.1 hypothetical protein [Massilia sp. IC2-278]
MKTNGRLRNESSTIGSCMPSLRELLALLTFAFFASEATAAPPECAPVPIHNDHPQEIRSDIKAPGTYCLQQDILTARRFDVHSGWSKAFDGEGLISISLPFRERLPAIGSANIYWIEMDGHRLIAIRFRDIADFLQDWNRLQDNAAKISVLNAKLESFGLGSLPAYDNGCATAMRNAYTGGLKKIITMGRYYQQALRPQPMSQQPASNRHPTNNEERTDA